MLSKGFKLQGESVAMDLTMLKEKRRWGDMFISFNFPNEFDNVNTDHFF